MAFSLITLLFLLSGSMLLYQWNGYSNELADIPEKNVEQTIQVLHQSGQFTIDQTINGLDEGQYHIVFPEQAEGMVCTDDKQRDCSMDMNGRLTVGTGNSGIRLSYHLPAQESAGQLLLEDWSAKLKDVDVTSTRVQVTERVWRSGEWIAAAETIGTEKMEMLDYYVFESDGPAPPMYWQDEPLIKTNAADNLVIFSEGPLKWDYSSLEQLPEPLSNGEKLYAIISDRPLQTKNDSFLTLSLNQGIESLKEEAARRRMKEHFSLPDEELWLADVAVSVLMGYPAGNAKAGKMYSELKNKLGAEQFDTWLHSLLDSNVKKWDSKKMDEAIFNTTGYKTAFFTENRIEEESLKPLFFSDGRDIYIGGKRAPDVFLVHRDGKSYITLHPLLEALGYTVSIQGKEKMEARKTGETYLFYPGKRLFLYNGHQFGLRSVPVLQINGSSYMDTAYLKTVFHVIVTEKERTISIQP
ncbi:MAG TPA: stalk domain-containing protein [Bacillaceae bacterium]